MNSAKPTKKATPTSKREGDKRTVKAGAKLRVNGNSDSRRSAFCRHFRCWTLALGSSWIAELGIRSSSTTNQEPGSGSAQARHYTEHDLGCGGIIYSRYAADRS
jgi:hypothetical protein